MSCLEMGGMLHAGSATSIRLTLSLMIFAAGFASAESFAQGYPIREVGGWKIAASQDGKGCFLSRVYEGPGSTTLLLGVDIDRSNRLSVLNSNWSIEKNDRQRLDFRLSNVSFPKHLAVGIASDGQKGFVTSFGESFPAKFAASTFIHIFRGDIPVEKLDLSGSGVAVAELRRCVDLYRRKPATAASDGRPRDIPIDPFAPDAERRPKK